jgi:hypothetical protein
VIGFLSGASFETMRDYVSVFQQGLADSGFVWGRNVAIEYRWAEGHNDRLPALAADTPAVLGWAAVCQEADPCNAARFAGQVSQPPTPTGIIKFH